MAPHALAREIDPPTADRPLRLSGADLRLRPDWVLETRTGTGGRAAFLASICELIDSGRVLAIDDYRAHRASPSTRITASCAAIRPPTKRRPRPAKIVGEPPQALVIMGGAGAPEVKAAFRNYAALVPVGSYVVVEDTILDGIPVWPGFGSGPMASRTRSSRSPSSRGIQRSSATDYLQHRGIPQARTLIACRRRTLEQTPTS